MLDIFRRRQPQTTPNATAADTILERGIDVLIAERDFHLSEAKRLANIVHNAQAALDQHNRLFEALNNTLFNINHPFNDAPPVEIADNLFDDIEIDFDMSIDHPTADEEQAAAILAPSAVPMNSVVGANLDAALRGDFDHPTAFEEQYKGEIAVETLDAPTNLRRLRKRAG